MADPAQIEQELREYLEKEPNIRRGDRIVYLMAIINKHYGIDQVEHLVSHYDFDQMLSYAKTNFATTKMPMTISKKEVNQQETVYVLMMEAFSAYLNKHKLLKRLVKFDHGR